jgi:hypothetical protein
MCNERQIDPASQINGKRKAREGSEKKHGSTDRIRRRIELFQQGSSPTRFRGPFLPRREFQAKEKEGTSTPHHFNPGLMSAEKHKTRVRGGIKKKEGKTTGRKKGRKLRRIRSDSARRSQAGDLLTA